MLRSLSIPAGRRSRIPRVAATIALLLPILACGSSKKDGPPTPTDPGNAISSIEIAPAIPLVAPGDDLQCTATARYTDGSSADVTTSATWASSDPTALALSNDAGSEGLATRLTDGSAEVTATLGSLSASVRVSAWATEVASSLRFDGNWSGIGTGLGIGRLAIDAGAVYWAAFDQALGPAGGSILRLPKTGGAPVLLAGGRGGLNGLASDGAYVYWTEFELAGDLGAVKRVPVGGGAVQVLASGTPPGSTFDVLNPAGIAVDGTYAYWGEAANGGAIRRVPKAGGSVVDFGRGQGFGPAFLAIAGGNVYGVTNEGGASVIGRLSGEILVSDVLNPSNLAADATSLYWAEVIGPAGRVLELTPSGSSPGPVTPLATGIDLPRWVAVQGGFVYFTGAIGSSAERRVGVWRVPVGGGTPELAAAASATADGFDPLTVVADATHLYFVDGAGSAAGHARLLRAPRD